MKELAPIALFVYNRPAHAKQTVEALQKNYLADESDLIIFSDGTKSLDDNERIQEVRKYINTVEGFRSVRIIERGHNCGLANSIISGVTETVNKSGRVIVLEDDMVTSPYFLRFINEALEFYKDEEKVISIHGYIYPVKAKLPDTFFLRGADCWGWATWKRGWDLFESDGQKLLDEIKEKNLEERFNINGAYPYTRMLENQVNGYNDSWAIRWYASAFLKEKLTLYPGRSLIYNIGLDKSGTHCNATYFYDSGITLESISVVPIPIVENALALKEIEKYFRSAGPSFLRKVKNMALRCKVK